MRLVWDASRSSCILIVVLQVVSGLSVAGQLFAGRQLLTAVLAVERDGGGVGDVTSELLVVAAATLVLTFVTSIQAEQQRIMAELVSRHVDARLLDVAVSVDLAAFETPAFYDRLQRAQLAGQSRPWQMTLGLLSFVSGTVTVLAIGVAVLTIQPLLLPLVVLASVPLWLATIRNSRSSHAFAWRITPTDRERRYLAQVLMGREFAKEVRVFGLEHHLRASYDGLFARRIAGVRELTRERLGRLIPAGLATAALTAATLVILVAFLLDGRIDLAGATVAAVGVQQLGVRLRTIYASAGSLYEGALFLEDFNSFVDLQPEPLGDDRAIGAGPGLSVLRVEDVSFSYPGTDAFALTNVSLELGADEVIALVGENGSGKTTLAKLLCHLYVPTSGRISWDGVDTTACDPVELRRSVTGIFQDFAQYHLSAAENITFGRPERDEDLRAVEAAAKRAGAHEVLAGLPHGYRTRLGRQFEGGHELSIGQWQRVALARAFFRDAPLLILDEPTAALDARAEHALFESIRELARGRSVVIISHRFASVRSADRIYVLEAGHVREYGSHDQLMAMHGLYSQMFDLQASAYLRAGAPPDG